MENTIQLKPIGKVNAVNGQFSIKLKKEFLPALTSLEEFTHLQVVWWGHLYDNPEDRNRLVIPKPYKNGPDAIGVFATRSEMRPNPILITTVPVASIDFENGIIHLYFIDAIDGTMVLDLKPYHKTERVKECRVPQWCSHWPQWFEEAATFNWQNEFNF